MVRMTAASRGRWALLLPAALLMAVAVLAPIVRLIALSLERTELTAGLHSSFAGIEMYMRAWRDGRWWSAVGNTLEFTAWSVGTEMLLGIAFALLLNRSFPGRRWARAIVLVPWALPTAVMALAWGWIFNDSFGVLNDLFGRAGAVRELDQDPTPAPGAPPRLRVLRHLGHRTGGAWLGRRSGGAGL